MRESCAVPGGGKGTVPRARANKARACLGRGAWVGAAVEKANVDPVQISPETVYITIPVHNRKTYTLGCLRSLRRQTVAGFHTVVVDDGSTDGTAEAVRAEFPEVVILKGDGNLWWSGAMNLGVRYALDHGAGYVLSLNDDLELAEDYVEGMLGHARDYPEAIFGSYIFDIETRRPWSAGERKNWRWHRPITLLDILPEAERRGLHDVSDAVGRGLWIPATIFQAIGLFDARWLPHYGGDNDFTLRAVRCGYKLYANLDARLYSYTEESGQLAYRKTYSVSNWARHLFGIKGGGNLRNFTIIALRHCPKRYVLWYWSSGVAWRVGGYLARWMGRRTVNTGRPK